MYNGHCFVCGSDIGQRKLLGAQCIGCAPCHASQQPSPSSPSPYNHAPPGSPPPANGPKRAVICGIEYKNSLRPLKGGIYDAKSMRDLLINRFKFPKSSIIMLTEDETDPCRRIPTKQNLRTALKWLVCGCQSGDSLLFYYSGHGSQIKDDDGDEVDGFDEALCPLDYETEGKLVDDELNKTIVEPLPPGAKLHAIIDACHSGTALDLPFQCNMNNKTGLHIWEDQRRNGTGKGTKGGNAILFSGCFDYQSSYESRATSEISLDQKKKKEVLIRDKLTAGLMTFAFIHAIKKCDIKEHTYGSILMSMRKTIESIDRRSVQRRRMNNGSSLGDADSVFLDNKVQKYTTSVVSLMNEGSSFGGAVCSVFQERRRSRLRSVGDQEPQLSTVDRFDIHSKPFSL